ncbi:MAG: hypothetical protein LBQ06_03410 [Frankiaceae bacterium]|nr:hypothetical protein [Frankiaceae bacterium]
MDDQHVVASLRHGGDLQLPAALVGTAPPDQRPAVRFCLAALHRGPHHLQGTRMADPMLARGASPLDAPETHGQ